MKALSFLVVTVVTLFVVGCSQRDKNGNLPETPTYGHIKIAIDESLRPLLDAELDTFEALYTNAQVDPTYTSESEAMDLLFKDSARLAIITRSLTPEEIDAFKKMALFPKPVKIAYDAVAIILNRNNPDSVLEFSQLQAMLQGKLTDWKQVNPRSTLGPMQMVLDNPQSGLVRFMKDSISSVPELPKNFYAMKNNKAVSEYVSKNPSAIGWIGVSWISDRDDSASRAFLSTIRVARISKTGEAVQPYQAYIADSQYPLRREVYIISREPGMGLGYGFMAFVAGDKGQRIVLKSGMVPATMPVRLINVHRN